MTEKSTVPCWKINHSEHYWALRFGARPTSSSVSINPFRTRPSTRLFNNSYHSLNTGVQVPDIDRVDSTPNTLPWLTIVFQVSNFPAIRNVNAVLTICSFGTRPDRAYVKQVFFLFVLFSFTRVFSKIQ